MKKKRKEKKRQSASKTRRAESCLGNRLLISHSQVDLVLLDKVSLLLDLSEIDVDDGIITVKDAGNLLECGTLGLDVKVVDKDKLDGVPEGVEEHKVPVVGEVDPGLLVGLAAGLLVTAGYSCDSPERRITHFPMARIAWTVMFMIIIPLARRWKGRISRA